MWLWLSVFQAGLKPRVLPLPLNTGIKGVGHHRQAFTYFYSIFLLNLGGEVCVCHHAHLEVGGQLSGFSFSFHHVNHGVQTQAVRLGDGALTHSTSCQCNPGTLEVLCL